MERKRIDKGCGTNPDREDPKNGNSFDIEVVEIKLNKEQRSHNTLQLCYFLMSERKVDLSRRQCI